MTSLPHRTDWRQLSKKLESNLSTSRAATLKRRIYAKRTAEKRRRVVLAGSVVLALVAGLVSWHLRSLFNNRETTNDLPEAPPIAAVEQIKNTPVAEAMETGTRFTVEEGISQRVYHLSTGKVRFRTQKHNVKPLEVHIGELIIEDIGTVFTVERLPKNRARVAVQEGRVRVAWADGEKILMANESGDFPPEHLLKTRPRVAEQGGRLHVKRPEDGKDVMEDKGGKALPGKVLTAAPRTPSKSLFKPQSAPPKDWRVLARQGRYRDAHELLEHSPSIVPDRPSDLLLAADVMRLGGNPTQAAEYLDRIVKHHKHDSRVTLAAFTLGRVYLDELGRPRQAAEIFETVGRGKSPLCEEALAREVEAWSRAGDTGRAREAAMQYLAKYPQGDRVDAVRALGGLNDR